MTVLLLLGSGCALAGETAQNGDTPDAGSHPGSGAQHDAGPGSGSGSCTPSTTDLLMNGAFDSTPIGANWMGTPANPTYPIVTASGLTPQSAPDKAWMGSVVSASDEMYEDVAIPASATGLVLAGYSEVRTTETGTTAADTATVELQDTSGTKLESILSLDNTDAGTTWVSFSHPITSNVAGKTVRVHFASTNNSTKATSFYYDTLSLTATACN